MNPIILIPARMNSTRLPGKPLRAFGGVPMIVRVYEAAKKSGVGEVVVAAGDPEIAEAVERAGGRAVMTDPELPSGSDRIYAALATLDPGKKYDAIVNLQGDMLQFEPTSIAVALALLQNPSVDIGTLAVAVGDQKKINDPAVVKAVIDFTSPERGEVGALAPGGGKSERNTDPLPNPPPEQGRGNTQGRATNFSRQPTPASDGRYYEHIGLYVYRRAALEKFVGLPPSAREKSEKLEQLRALDAGMRIDVAIVDKAPYSIDTEEQAAAAETHYFRKVPS